MNGPRIWGMPSRPRAGFLGGHLPRRGPSRGCGSSAAEALAAMAQPERRRRHGPPLGPWQSGPLPPHRPIIQTYSHHAFGDRLGPLIKNTPQPQNWAPPYEICRLRPRGRHAPPTLTTRPCLRLWGRPRREPHRTGGSVLSNPMHSINRRQSWTCH